MGSNRCHTLDFNDQISHMWTVCPYTNIYKHFTWIIFVHHRKKIWTCSHLLALLTEKVIPSRVMSIQDILNWIKVVIVYRLSFVLLIIISFHCCKQDRQLHHKCFANFVHWLWGFRFAFSNNTQMRVLIYMVMQWCKEAPIIMTFLVYTWVEKAMTKHFVVFMGKVSVFGRLFKHQ